MASDLQFTEQENALRIDLRFKNFVVAMAFMQEVALLAQEMNHHPEWSNVYHRVSIALTTHDAENQVTEKDYALAEAIIGVAQKLGGKACVSTGDQ